MENTEINLEDNLENAETQTTENDQVILALTSDLQRQRADFENYRKRVEGDLAFAKKTGEKNFAKKVLPLLDVFDSVFANLTNEIAETDFGRGISLAQKNFAKVLNEMNLEKISIKIGDEFDHEKMFAVSADESEGETEIIAEILQNGYTYNGEILRAAMVKISRK